MNQQVVNNNKGSKNKERQNDYNLVSSSSDGGSEDKIIAKYSA